MKNWLKHPSVIIFLIIIASALFYHSSFGAPFFREDRFFLDVQMPRDLFRFISDVHYHPISIQLFYYFGRLLFGSNVFLYHLTLFIFYSCSFFFIFHIAKSLTKSVRKSLLVIFLYAFNISFFAHYFWIAVSYFTLGAFFFFGTIFFYQRKGKKSAFMAVVFFLASLLTNEVSIVLSAIFILFSFVQNFFSKRLLILTIISLLFAFYKFILFKVPAQYGNSYQLRFDLEAFKTFQWYVLRALNLPEGIRINLDNWIIGFFAVSLLILAISFVSYIRQKSKKVPLLFFGISYFVICGTPFFLLSNHISSYYLGFAFFGFALILIEILSRHKLLLVLYLLVYLFLSFRGLEYLEKTHWIILKNVGWPGKFYQLTDYTFNLK